MGKSSSAARGEVFSTVCTTVTALPSRARDRSGSPGESELFIEFDGQQLVVRTDVPAVQEFLTDAFHNMLSETVTHEAGRLGVFAHGDDFRIDSAESAEIIGGEIEYLLNLVKAEVRIQFMRVRRVLLWLHAAAVERDGTAMLLAGPSGQGKSTLTSLLCRRGWRMMSDDVAPVRMDRNEVVSFCQTPVMRIPRDRVLEPHKRVGLVRHRVELAPHELRQGPAPIRSIGFLAFSPGSSLIVTRLTKGETALELLRNSINLVDHKAAAVARAAELAQGLLGVSLSYGSSAEAADLLDSMV